MWTALLTRDKGQPVPPERSEARSFVSSADAIAHGVALIEAREPREPNPTRYRREAAVLCLTRNDHWHSQDRDGLFYTVSVVRS